MTVTFMPYWPLGFDEWVEKVEEDETYVFAFEMADEDFYLWLYWEMDEALAERFKTARDLEPFKSYARRWVLDEGPWGGMEDFNYYLQQQYGAYRGEWRNGR